MGTSSTGTTVPELGKTEFYNIGINITDKKNVMNICNRFFLSDKTRTVFFLNAHCFNIAQKNQKYRNALNNSDLVLNDGIGIKLGSYLAGIKIRENLNGTDLIPEILSLAANNRKKVFFLGGKEGVAEKASQTIKDRIPEMQIAGCLSGYFSKKEEQEVIEKVNSSEAELLVLGMGVPKQELWASRNRDKLENIKIIIAGGAILDFLSGRIRRAPLWMRKMNMEWVFRLINEPGRLWKRYIIGNILFVFYLFRIRIIAKKGQPLHKTVHSVR